MSCLQLLRRQCDLLRHGVEALGTLRPLVGTHISVTAGSMGCARTALLPSAADVATIRDVARLAQQHLAPDAPKPRAASSPAAVRRWRRNVLMAGHQTADALLESSEHLMFVHFMLMSQVAGLHAKVVAVLHLWAWAQGGATRHPG